MSERIARLATLDDEGMSCANGDDDCPCGSYCNGLTAVCEVDCIAGMADPPGSIPGCTSGSACTSDGRCDTGSGTPLVQSLTLQFAAPLITANTVASPVLVPVSVSVTANSLDFIQADHPAIVRYRFQPGTTSVAEPPKVKCSATGTLADACDASSWMFRVGSGLLVSDPQTIWVQVPQTAVATTWTLEARSEWATTPATAIIQAAPASFPVTDTGNFAGTMIWTNSGSNNSLSVPVQAIVTATNVALYEPTRLLLPDGHAVFSRDPTQVTLVSWLTSGTKRYDVPIGVRLDAYDAATGHLSGSGSYMTGSKRATSIAFALQFAGDSKAPKCSFAADCSSGNYCDPVMHLCLAGTGPASGAGIVKASSVTPSPTLASSLVSAWSAPLSSLLSSQAMLLSGTTPREQLERPYCYQIAGQSGPATFARTTTLLSPSDDLACTAGAAESPQKTFPLVNRRQEVGDDGAGNTFSLVNDCAADLDEQPSAGLPASHTCASLGRFLLALRPTPIDDIGYRLKTQLVRQWLGVNAYLANAVIQDQAYANALGVAGDPPATRMGHALDRMDQDLAVLLDQSVHSMFDLDDPVRAEAAGTPDYRFLRPSVRLSFNEVGSSTYINAETGQAIAPCQRNPAGAVGTWQPTNGDTTDFPCRAANAGRLSSAAGLSLVLALDKTANKPGANANGDGLVKVTDASGGRGLDVWAQAHLTNGNPALKLTLFDTATGTVLVTFPDIFKSSGFDLSGVGFGMVAITKQGSSYRLVQVRPGVPAVSYTVAGVDVPLVLPSGTLALGGASETIDELAVWPRALALEEIVAMASQYYANFTGHVVTTNQTLPAAPVPVPGKEQTVGLPVHVLEAADADLNLAQSYLAAKSVEIYTQCLLGQHAALDDALGKLGRALRTTAILQDEAARMLTTIGTGVPWYARYQAGATELAGRRADVVTRVAALQSGECKNPLGISEEDLPLYVGSTGSSAAERFFAGSRFLASAAMSEIDVAGGATGTDGLLAQARQAYNAARMSQFQEDAAAHDTADRVLKISTDYEDQLKRYCGVPPGEDVFQGHFPLLSGFQNGTYTATNCFLKTELPQCVGLENTPVESVPTTCLRGEMGERVLAIQAAAVDAENANHALDRAIDQYNSDGSYCAHLQEALTGNQALLAAHLHHMQELRTDRNDWGIAFSIINSAKGAAVTVLTHGVGGGGGISGPEGLFKLYKDLEFEQELQAEEDAYQLAVSARSNAQQIAACERPVDNEKFAIDAARDTIRRAAEQTKAALFSLEDDQSAVLAMAGEGAGQLARESTIDRTPPHLHYWLAESISSYNAHMAYARRLTYLAVRAYEYEAQQSSGLRSAVLIAALPNDLKVAASAILGASAPIAGRPIDDGPVVLSLRDDILQIADLSQASSRLDGTAPLTPTEAFKELLTSDASRIYDATGHYVGHGIRFSLRPGPVDAQTCAERLSRIKPSVTVENASQEITHTRLILAAANTFGSQSCGLSSPPGTLQMARIQPSQALLVGDAVPTFANPSAYSTTGLFPFINTSRDALRTMMFTSDDPSAFAGRGYFGDYILIFPDDPQACTPTLCDGWSQDALDKVDDVLLRFDVVEQDNTHL